MKMCNCICQAEEEVQRLNVKICCLHTAIRDEQVFFCKVCACHQDTNDPMFSAVKNFTELRKHISELLSCIHQIYALDGFTGVHGPELRVGSALPLDNDQDEPKIHIANNNQAIDKEVDVLENDKEQNMLGHLVEFLTSLAI
jgi:hypothetical protein